MHIPLRPVKPNPMQPELLSGIYKRPVSRLNHSQGEQGRNPFHRRKIMIIDRIGNAHLYSNLGPRFALAFDWLRQTDLAAQPLGKYELDGKNVFVAVQEYTTKAAGQGKWEAHRRYIDVQYIVHGTEQICWAQLGRMQQGAYDDAKDFLALSGTGDFVTLHGGDFMILFPDDAHMPNMAIGEPSTVKKAVVKIAAG